MMGTPRLSVIVPAFNEAARIDRTLDSLRTALPGLAPSWEVRVVDDGSSDDTAERVERVAAEDERIVLQRQPHHGKGAAVRAGMLAAHGDLR